MGFWLEWNLRQSAESNFTTALNSVHPSSIELFPETFGNFCWVLTTFVLYSRTLAKKNLMGISAPNCPQQIYYFAPLGACRE